MLCVVQDPPARSVTCSLVSVPAGQVSEEDSATNARQTSGETRGWSANLATVTRRESTLTPPSATQQPGSASVSRVTGCRVQSAFYNHTIIFECFRKTVVLCVSCPELVCFLLTFLLHDLIHLPSYSVLYQYRIDGDSLLTDSVFRYWWGQV